MNFICIYLNLIWNFGKRIIRASLFFLGFFPMPISSFSSLWITHFAICEWLIAENQTRKKDERSVASNRVYLILSVRSRPFSKIKQYLPHVFTMHVHFYIRVHMGDSYATSSFISLFTDALIFLSLKTF